VQAVFKGVYFVSLGKKTTESSVPLEFSIWNSSRVRTAFLSGRTS